MTVPSATLSLTSEEDEIIIPDGITAISYSFTEDGEPITRQIAVEPTDTVKYYKEEDGYYTLAVYDNTGAIKSKGYTLHSDDIPKIDVTYSADVNNNFTESDEYNGFVPTTKVEIKLQKYEPASVYPPSGITCVLFELVIGNSHDFTYLRDSENDIYEVTIQREKGTGKVKVCANGISKTRFNYDIGQTYYFIYGTRYN